MSLIVRDASATPQPMPLEHRKVNQIVNLGDCVSGPLWPRETAELLMRLDWPTIRSNHDRWVTDWLTEQHYPSDAFAFRALDAAQLAWLRALPPTRDLGDGIFAYIPSRVASRETMVSRG